jgi:hypothetical protein
MLKKIVLYFWFFCATIINAQVQQVTLGPIKADYGREVIFKWESGDFVQVNDLITDQFSYLRANSSYGENRFFAFSQWSIPDSLIPDGSTIDYVQFYAQTINLNGTEIELSHNSKDITADNLTYNNFNTEVYPNIFFYSPVPTPSTLNYNTDDDSDLNGIKAVIENSLPSDRLTLIVIADNMPIGYIAQIVFPTLTIKYTPPSQNISVRQKLSNGTEFGQIGHFENNNWVNYPSGHTFTFGLNNTEYLQADTNKNSNEKFNNWNTTYSYLNFLSFTVENGINSLTANFSAVNGVNLNFSAENTTTQYDSIKLKDPWLRDSSDAKGF